MGFDLKSPGSSSESCLCMAPWLGITVLGARSLCRAPATALPQELSAASQAQQPRGLFCREQPPCRSHAAVGPCLGEALIEQVL